MNLKNLEIKISEKVGKWKKMHEKGETKEKISVFYTNVYDKSGWYPVPY